MLFKTKINVCVIFNLLRTETLVVFRSFANSVEMIKIVT